MCHECNPGQGFSQPNHGFPGYHTQYNPTYQHQYQPHYRPYFGPHVHPGFDPQYGFQNPPPRYQQPHDYPPANSPANDGRIAVTNSNCGEARTSNFGNTHMTNCGNNHHRLGNHHAENYGHMRSLHENKSRTTRVGNVSSNGGSASANTTSKGYMTNANIKGGTNHSSGYQCGGAGGAVNIGRGY